MAITVVHLGISTFTTSPPRLGQGARRAPICRGDRRSSEKERADLKWKTPNHDWLLVWNP